jgi:hypothetical protein
MVNWECLLSHRWGPENAICERCGETSQTQEMRKQDVDWDDHDRTEVAWDES